VTGTPFEPQTGLYAQDIDDEYQKIDHPHNSNMPKQIVWDRMHETEDIVSATEKKYAKYK
jgi:hypothetical protein